MRRSNLILMLVMIGMAVAAIAWAAIWPVALSRPETDSPQEPGKRDAARPVTGLMESEVFKMRWQSWQNKKQVIVAATKPATPPPSPPSPPVIEKPPGVGYQGAIFEHNYAFGFFTTPSGPKYAAVGEVVKVGAETMKVLKIETAGSTVEYRGRAIRLDIERRENRLGGLSRLPGAPPIPPPSVNRPDLKMPIILNRTNP